MKLLFVTEKLPFPLDTGGNVRSWHLLQGLARDHEVTLLAGTEPDFPPASIEAFRPWCRTVLTTPLPARSAVADVFTLAGGLGSAMPFLMARRESRALRLLLRRALAADPDYDVVHFNHLDATLYQDELPAGVRCVLDQHNIVTHQVRTTLVGERRAARRWVLARDLPRLAAFERDACSRMDACLVCSDADREALRELGGPADAWVVPNGVDVEYFRPGAPARGGPPQLVFVGTLDYDPCEQGVWHFCREILPLIQAREPSVLFTVVGRNPSARLQQLARSQPAVRLLGRVEDVRPPMRAAHLAVVPLLAGSGTRLKILEAMALGIPVVTTTIGAEGLPLVPGEHAQVADTPASFAAAVLGLLRDEPLRAHLAARGRELVEASFSWGAVQSRLRRAYDAVGSSTGTG